jgi:hypothetical protein
LKGELMTGLIQILLIWFLISIPVGIVVGKVLKWVNDD